MKRTVFYIIAIIPMMLWGVSFVWSKVVFKYYSPITTTFLRLLISSILLIIFLSVTRKFQKIKKEHYKIFFLLSLVDPFGYFLCESFGINLLPSVIASIIISTIPLFSAFFGYFFMKERLTVFNFSGVFISFVGIGIMVLKKDFSFIASPLGVLLIFGAVFFALIYSIIIKDLSQTYKPMTIIAVQNILASFYFLPLFLIFDFDRFIMVKPNFELVSTLIMLTVLCSVLAFVIYIRTIKEIGIAKTNMFTNLISVFTLIAAYFIIDEVITLKSIVGMIVVIAGLYISQTHPKAMGNNVKV
ncbi:MAG: DMT family transporter [Bacteroidales bacterium]|nr:DMT family transporter [Bacteroidales bacterium]